MMLKVRNYSGTVIIIDDIVIPNGGSELFESFKNQLYVNSLVNKRMITVTNIDVTQPKQVEDVKFNTTEDIVQTPEERPIRKEIPEEVVTNTSTTKKKKSKDNNNNSEVENSKSTKGDMNNATD